jgi:hypothetical protein
MPVCFRNRATTLVVPSETLHRRFKRRRAVSLERPCHPRVCAVGSEVLRYEMISFTVKLNLLQLPFLTEESWAHCSSLSEQPS